MRFAVIALLAIASVQAVQLENQVASAGAYKVVNNKIFLDGCPTPIPNTEAELALQLEEFGRQLDKTHYTNAMAIYEELKKEGKDPKVRVNTYEYLDQAFKFERVRRYDLVQQHMALVEHLQDNLNQNFTNGQNVDQFLIVAKAALAAFNTKYHNGEFADPNGTDPRNPADPTWATVKF
jgi:hypothetical protein